MVQYAEDRSSNTRFELGEMFEKNDRARDYRSAFRWYLHSAKHGCRKAQHRLGTMYARGQGVSQNYAEAYAWFKVATFQKSKRAKRKLEVIEAKLSLEQLRRGRWLAQDYYDRFVIHRHNLN